MDFRLICIRKLFSVFSNRKYLPIGECSNFSFSRREKLDPSSRSREKYFRRLKATNRPILESRVLSSPASNISHRLLVIRCSDRKTSENKFYCWIIEVIFTFPSDTRIFSFGSPAAEIDAAPRNSHKFVKYLPNRMHWTRQYKMQIVHAHTSKFEKEEAMCAADENDVGIFAFNGCGAPN